MRHASFYGAHYKFVGGDLSKSLITGAALSIYDRLMNETIFVMVPNIY